MDTKTTTKPADAQPTKQQPIALRAKRAALLRVKTNLQAGTFGGGLSRENFTVG